MTNGDLMAAFDTIETIRQTQQPMRHWVLSFPFQLRFLFSTPLAIMGQVLGIVYRAIATHLIKKTGLT